MNTIIRLITTSTAATLIFGALTTVTATAASAVTPTESQAAHQFCDFVNAQRAAYGLSGLSCTYNGAAQAAISAGQYDPTDVWLRGTQTPGAALVSFMNSQTHRNILMSDNATTMDIGVACNGQALTPMVVGANVDLFASAPVPATHINADQGGVQCPQSAPPTTPAPTQPPVTQPPVTQPPATPNPTQPSAPSGGGSTTPPAGGTPTPASPVVSASTHNGAVTVTRQDGTKTTTTANGTVTTTLPNGTKVIKSTNGTVTFISKDGTKTIVTKDGHRTVVRPGDATTTTAPTSTAPSHVKPIASKAPSQPSHRVSQSRIPAWVWIAAGIAALAIVATAVWLTMRSRRSGVAE